MNKKILSFSTGSKVYGTEPGIMVIGFFTNFQNMSTSFQMMRKLMVLVVL